MLNTLNLQNWEITAYYGYRSSVIDRIATQSHNYKTQEHDFLEKIWSFVWEKAELKGFKLDNKIVLQLTNVCVLSDSPKSVLYIGRYDNIISLGLSMYSR